MSYESQTNLSWVSFLTPVRRTPIHTMESPSGLSCCPPGSWPALESQPGSYRGKEVDLGNGLLAYVVLPPNDEALSATQPPSPKQRLRGLISFPDIYRYDTGRNKGVMDQFAAGGGFVVAHVDFVGPTDFFTDDQDLMTFVKERRYQDFIQAKLIQTVIPYLRDQHNVESIGAIGFCWGCYIALQACADPAVKDAIAATALFHPTFQLHAAFDETDRQSLTLAQSVACPTLLIPAGNDPDFCKPPDGAIVQVLRQTNSHSTSVVMPAMAHGFVIRGDATDPAVHRDVQASLTLAIEFLTTHV